MIRILIAIYFASLLMFCGCGGSSPVGDAPSTSDQTGGGLLPAGTYSGSVLITTTTMSPKPRYNVATRQMEFTIQAVPSFVPSPFAGGNLELDGKGTYRMPGWATSPKFGVYTFDRTTKVAAFITGPMAGVEGSVSFASNGAPTISVKLPAAKDNDQAKSLDVTFSNATQNPAATEADPSGATTKP